MVWLEPMKGRLWPWRQRSVSFSDLGQTCARLLVSPEHRGDGDEVDYRVEIAAAMVGAEHEADLLDRICFPLQRSSAKSLA